MNSNSRLSCATARNTTAPPRVSLRQQRACRCGSSARVAAGARVNLQDGGGGQARVGSEGRLHRRGGGGGGVGDEPAVTTQGRPCQEKETPQRKQRDMRAAGHAGRGTCGTLPMAPSPTLDSSGPDKVGRPDKVGTEPHMRHTVRRLLRRLSPCCDACPLFCFSGPDISRRYPSLLGSGY